MKKVLLVCPDRADLLRHSEIDLHRRLQHLSAGADRRRGHPAVLQVGTRWGGVCLNPRNVPVYMK